MKRILTAAILFALLVVFLPASPAPATTGVQKWFEKAVKKVEGAFTPAEAKPGQTVTFTLTIELNEGYHTYPTVQPDKMATGMVNTIQFPKPGAVVFVGNVQDPKDAKTKAEPELGIAELRYCTGKVVYTRKAVVSPKAAPGPATVKLEAFKLSVCDKDNCFAPKNVPVEATLKVLDGPAVPVEKEFAEEVRKALGEK
jgi:hypothetical protein